MAKKKQKIQKKSKIQKKASSAKKKTSKTKSAKKVSKAKKVVKAKKVSTKTVAPKNNLPPAETSNGGSDSLLEKAMALIQAQTSENVEEILEELEANAEDAPGIQIINGPHKVSDLKIGDTIVIVNGDLIVENTLEDSYKTDSSLLIVLGNVFCKNLITLSAIHIIGNLSVSNVILGDSLCDYSLTVDGDIHAPTILDYGHDIRATGKVQAKDIYSFNSVEDKDGNVDANLSQQELHPELMKEDNGEMLTDLRNTISYIQTGGTRFRA